MLVPCIDGHERPYVALDAAASTGALGSVLDRVEEFLPSYSSVHRGAGYKSQLATAAYENARDAARSFAGRQGRDDIAIICRNTTEALNHLAYRLRLSPDDVVVTSVVEHHANLLPWSRVATCRYVECRPDGRSRLATSRPHWTSPRSPVCSRSPAHRTSPGGCRDRRDHRRRPRPSYPCRCRRCSARASPSPSRRGRFPRLERPQDVRTLRRRACSSGLAGRSRKVILSSRVVAPSSSTRPSGPTLQTGKRPALRTSWALWRCTQRSTPLVSWGWPAIVSHDRHLAHLLREGLPRIPGVRVLGPDPQTDTLPVATFTVEGLPHALWLRDCRQKMVSACGMGCFCAHPYLMRLLGPPMAKSPTTATRCVEATAADARSRAGQRRHQHHRGRHQPPARRSRPYLLGVSKRRSPTVQDPRTGDFTPEPGAAAVVRRRPISRVPRAHPASTPSPARGAFEGASRARVLAQQEPCRYRKVLLLDARRERPAPAKAEKAPIRTRGSGPAGALPPAAMLTCPKELSRSAAAV